MHFLKLFLLSSLFLFPLPGNEKASLKTTYTYAKEVEGRSSETTWTLEKNGEALHIQGEGSGGSTLIVTSPQMETQSFVYKSKNEENEYSIFRDGRYLVARLNQAGEKAQKEFNLGNRTWVQEFDFSFRPFILSTADTYKFCIVHPKKLSLHNMIAAKTHYETLSLGGKTYQTVRVKVTLTGFKKMFWKADLWFERQTGDLLKYVSNEGPNTPTSIITLLSKSS